MVFFACTAGFDALELAVDVFVAALVLALVLVSGRLMGALLSRSIKSDRAMRSSFTDGVWPLIIIVTASV